MPEEMIARPEKVVPTPLAPVPVWSVPKMSEIAGINFSSQRAAPGPRPVSEADFETLIPWSVEKMNGRFPRLTQESLVHWTRSSLKNPRIRIIRTDNAWGAAIAATTFFEPEITVSDIFVVAQRATVDEALSIYRNFLQWAQGLNAVEVIFGSSTGVDISPFMKRLEGFSPKHMSFVRKLR
jgi:hypothetical protein